MVHFDDFDEYEAFPRIKNMPAEKSRAAIKYNPNFKQKRSPDQVRLELSEQVEDEQEFAFTYQASRHERVWLLEALRGFHQVHWLSDVLRIIKGGKEASVYLCATSPFSSVQSPYLAAKVYRPRRFRNLKNDHLYREGREDLDADGNVVLDGGMLHAMHKRTEYGRELLHTSWIEHEFKTMQMLHAAGADLPEPYISGSNTILMEYIGDDKSAAPTLNSLDLAPQEARPLFERVLHNIELMLAHERIHGDLSAYNLLYWEDRAWLIDFPQAISPTGNRNAFRIFERDVTRICEYFSHQGIPADPRQLAARLWTKRHYRIGPEVNPLFLDADDQKDREYWEKYGG